MKVKAVVAIRYDGEVRMSGTELDMPEGEAIACIESGLVKEVKNDKKKS